MKYRYMAIQEDYTLIFFPDEEGARFHNDTSDDQVVDLQTGKWLIPKDMPEEMVEDYSIGISIAAPADEFISAYQDPEADFAITPITNGFPEENT